MTVKVKFTVEPGDLMADGAGSALLDWASEDRIYEMAVLPRVGDTVTITIGRGESDDAHEPDVDLTVTDIHHFISDGLHEFTYLTVKKYRHEPQSSDNQAQSNQALRNLRDAYADELAAVIESHCPILPDGSPDRSRLDKGVRSEVARMQAILDAADAAIEKVH